jgi:hypothetical protein
MDVAQLKDEELAFLIQVRRIICQSRRANRNAALLDQLRAEYDRRYQQQDTSRHCHARKRKRPCHLYMVAQIGPVMQAANIVPLAR